jgi:hypothetical protein
MGFGSFLKKAIPVAMKAAMIGAKKKGGKIKRTGKYKLHKGEKEVRGRKVVRKVKRTAPYHVKKGEYIETAKDVKKSERRKRARRKRS